MQKIIVFSFFLLSDDPFCPVKLFLKYKGHLNPKCNRLFQRPSMQRTHVIGIPIFSLVTILLATWCLLCAPKPAFPSVIQINNSLRATTVNILDSIKIYGRHITSFTDHMSESTLKTYTWYTAPNEKCQRPFPTLWDQKNSQNLISKPTRKTILIL
jgi:hypothetical protein